MKSRQQNVAVVVEQTNGFKPATTGYNNFAKRPPSNCKTNYHPYQQALRSGKDLSHSNSGSSSSSSSSSSSTSSSSSSNSSGSSSNSSSSSSSSSSGGGSNRSSNISYSGSNESKSKNGEHSTINDNNIGCYDKSTSSTTPSPKLIPSHLLEQLASEILDHTKQLGLFDELRMKLLAGIESSKEFSKVESEFKREVDLFCERTDLSQPRSKIRERLNSRILLKCSNRLRDNVDQISRRHTQEIKQLYNEHAIVFIKTLQAKQKLQQSGDRSTQH